MQIYYFSRTGRSEKIAEELAARHDTAANRIDDGRDWSGSRNYRKAALMALIHKSVAVRYKKPTEGEEITVVFPLWAGTLPPAVRRFVKEVGTDKMTIIVTSLGSKLRNRKGFKKVVDLVGKEISLPEDM